MSCKKCGQVAGVDPRKFVELSVPEPVRELRLVALVECGLCAGLDGEPKCPETGRLVGAQVRLWKCPRQRFPDANGRTTWLGAEWRGVAAPRAIAALGPDLVEQLPFCGCLDRPKRIVERVHDLAVSNVERLPAGMLSVVTLAGLSLAAFLAAMT